MARPRRRAALSVVLNGRLVGRLTKESSGAIEFRYDPDWLAWEHAIPVSLSLLRSASARMRPSASPSPARKRRPRCCALMVPGISPSAPRRRRTS
ncbi:HipA N-terminal domain-containing protein [Acuticoccus kalidii]|uniref:HipA N-terminal domain-containing protein n=1 Tax=Acuticoccus kalidii TaxID=2910977 RepID=UPI0034E285F6